MALRVEVGWVAERLGWQVDYGDAIGGADVQPPVGVQLQLEPLAVDEGVVAGANPHLVRQVSAGAAPR